MLSKVKLFSKILVLSTSFSCFLSSKAQAETIIQCLGKEEHLIHKKQYNGPLYNLNQKLINTFIVSADLQLKAESIKKICYSSEYSPSVNLLRMLLLDGKNLFTNNESERVAKIQKEQMIEVFVSEIPPLFFQYLGDLQSQLASPNCLVRHIPEVRKLLENYQYLEPDLEWNKNILSPNKVNLIFTKLRGIDAINKKCQDEVKRKALMKKKDE